MLLLLAILVGMLLACIGPAAAQSAPVIRMTSGFQSASLEGHMAVLRDPTGALDLDAVAFGVHASRFKPIAAAFGAGYTPDPFWIRLPIVVEGRAPDLLLEMRPAFLDVLEIYVPRVARPSSATDFERSRTGDHMDFGARPAIAPSLITPIQLPADFDGYIYVRLETSSTVALRGALRTAPDMISNTTAQAVLFGLYMGIFLITGTANLMFWARLRDVTYLVYAGFIFNCAALMWCKSGLVPPEWMPGGATGVDHLMGLMMFASHGIGSLFASIQTNSRLQFPRIHLVFIAVAAISLGGMALTLLGHYQAVIGYAVWAIIPVALLALACNIVQMRRRVSGSLLATTAIGFQVAGVLAGSLMLNASVPYAGWMDYGFESGSIFFVIYMTLSLAQRARRAEADKLAAEAEAQHVARRTGELAAAKDQAEAALLAEQESQRQQIRFVDVISHQYRTPLAVISSTLSAMQKDLASGDEKGRDRVERARRAIKRLVEIIEVNGHRSRLQGVAAKADIADIAFVPFMENVVLRARELFPERSIKLENRGIARNLKARLDADMTELALVNLIENADKFSRSGLPITLLIGQSDGTLTISVVDRGIGIPSGERDLLTHKFFRASNSGGTSGLGIGLHLVNAAASAQGGDVLIDSTEGQGTMVTISLPALRLLEPTPALPHL